MGSLTILIVLFARFILMIPLSHPAHDASKKSTKTATANVPQRRPTADAGRDEIEKHIPTGVVAVKDIAMNISVTGAE
jgi:hypothetical protein